MDITCLFFIPEEIVGVVGEKSHEWKEFGQGLGGPGALGDGDGVEEGLQDRVVLRLEGEHHAEDSETVRLVGCVAQALVSVGEANRNNIQYTV